jgi:hypothetical protein
MTEVTSNEFKSVVNQSDDAFKKSVKDCPDCGRWMKKRDW